MMTIHRSLEYLLQTNSQQCAVDLAMHSGRDYQVP